MVQPASPAYTFRWGLSLGSYFLTVDAKLIGLARHQFALLSLLTIALVSSFWFLLDVLGTASQGTQSFGVPAFENRFSEFRKTVRPHTVFGYLSDNPPNDPSARLEFYLTQYTLAPAIVRASANESQVIMNYHSKQPDAKLLQSNHLVPVQDFGSGVLLCRRTQP